MRASEGVENKVVTADMVRAVLFVAISNYLRCDCKEIFWKNGDGFSLAFAKVGV